MKACKTCGTEVPDNASSCPTCGNPMADPVSSADGVPSSTAGSAQTDAPERKKKGKVPKIIVAIVIVLIALIAFGSCSNSCSKQKGSEQKDWPTGPLAQMIPSMDRKCEFVVESNDSLHITVSDGIAKKDFDSYVDKCEERGFTVDANAIGDSYEAYDSEGYKLSVRYIDFSKSNEISIDLDAPKTNGELIWPTMGLALKLPNPNKTKGSVAVDSATQFTAYVGEMDKASYNAYVDQCIEKGFSVDYDKGDTSFNAENAEGDSLHLEYQGFNTMYISLYAAKGGSSSSAASASSASSSSEAAQPSSPSTVASDGDFKQFMDDYEKFIDDYIAFMEKYNSSGNPVSMAADYAKMVADYATMTAKIDAIDEDSLTEEEDLYFIEVMNRVNEKLLNAALE